MAQELGGLAGHWTIIKPASCILVSGQWWVRADLIPFCQYVLFLSTAKLLNVGEEVFSSVREQVSCLSVQKNAVSIFCSSFHPCCKRREQMSPEGESCLNSLVSLRLFPFGRRKRGYKWTFTWQWFADAMGWVCSLPQLQGWQPVGWGLCALGQWSCSCGLHLKCSGIKMCPKHPCWQSASTQHEAQHSGVKGLSSFYHK